MGSLEPTGMTTIEAGSDDAHEDYNNNLTLINEQQVRYIQAQVGEAGGVDRWDVVYQSQADGKLYKALATSDLSQMPAIGMIAEAKGLNDWARAIYQGIIADDGWTLVEGTVLVLSRTLEGQYTILENELARDLSEFTVQQVLGFVISTTEVYVDVQRPAIFAGAIMKDVAFEESADVPPIGYGNRGLLRVEDVDGALELVYYDNGGQRIQITSGGALSISLPMKHENDYAYENVERLVFGCGTLEMVEGDPGTYKYTPPLAGEGTQVGGVCYFDGTAWVELVPGADGETLTTHAEGSAPTWEPAGGILSGVGAGDMLYWDGGAWALISAGAAGKVLTAAGAAIPTWEAAAGGDPEVFTKCIMQAIVNFGSTTVYQVGQGTHTNTGTVSSADDADGRWHNFASTAVLNNQAYLNNSVTITRRDHEETLVVRMKTAASIAVMRLWGAGWFSNITTAGGADVPNIHCAAFRFSTNAGDTNWMAYTAGAGGAGVNTITDTGIAVVANTVYTLRIVFSNDTPDVKFYINDVLVATHTTNLPGATDQIYYAVSVTTLEGVAKSFKWSRIARIGK